MTANVRVFATPAEVSAAARAVFLDKAHAAIRARKRFDVVLAGGRTPESVYKSLVDADVEWKRCHVYFGDERCVPPVHQDSNFKMAADALLTKVAIPPKNVHRIHAELEAYRAAEEYELELKRSLALDDGEWPRFDLVLLGMGNDGHTASLFPGTTALDDDHDLCCATWVEKLKGYRITLTFPVFDNAASVLFMACGADKATALRLVLASPVTAATPPAGRVRPPSGELVWFVDRALADAAHLSL